MGNITRGLTSVSAIKRGVDTVSAVYRGNQLVWSPVAPATGSYIVATGGTITYDGDYKIHTFTTIGSGSFVVSYAPASATASLLVVAGGGPGGPDVGTGGGGGGGGGVIYTTSASISAQTYTIVVGDGGAKGTNANPGLATQGKNSLFGTTFTAIGGGRGGAKDNYNGGNGGSGGGGAAYVQYTAGTGTAGQGNNGGAGQNGGLGAGGGGGAGAAGSAGSGGSGGNGGNGLAFTISGTSTYYGGGGGGGSEGGGSGTGGLGGGGNAGTSPQNGTDGLGGGGGGRTSPPYGQDGTEGGSGVVVVRYKYQESPAWVTDQLYAYYDPFASTISGGTISDLSGNGRSATQYRTWPSVTSGIGWYFNQTGASAPYAIAPSYNFEGNPVTLEVWFRVDAGSSYDSEPNLLSYEDSSNVNRNIQIGLKRSTENYIAFGQSQNAAGNSTEYKLTAEGSVRDSTIHQYVFVLPGTTTTGRMYRDGVEVKTGTDVAGDQYLNDTGFWFGGGPKYAAQSRGFSSAYGGLVRIYQKGLSAAEVLQNWNANKGDYGL